MTNAYHSSWPGAGMYVAYRRDLNIRLRQPHVYTEYGLQDPLTGAQAQGSVHAKQQYPDSKSRPELEFLSRVDSSQSYFWILLCI